MLLSHLVETSEAVSATRARSEKTRLLAELLNDLRGDEVIAAVSFLAGRPRQSPVGVGYRAVHDIDVDAADSSELEIVDVDAVLEEVSNTSGTGSQRAKHDLLSGLFARATQTEQEFLRGLILRNLRQGALEGVMADAVAAAIDVPATNVRRAVMLEGDLVNVAARALIDGPTTIDEASLTLFTPIQPMLAKTAGTVTEALGILGDAFVEQKLDGLRIQVHRHRDVVKVFTRNLRDVTDDMPEVVEQALAFGADSFILDGEGLITRNDGRPMSFQDSMSNRDQSLPGNFSGHYFDVLHVDGADLIDLSLEDRRLALEEAVPETNVVNSIRTATPDEGEMFFQMAMDAGFEGVVVKDPSQPYAAGRRGSGWLKVKPVHTLDLVILAVEWGSGRRQGWLSNLHLGARDGDDFVMLGKTFKGLTDEMLISQTERFLALEERRDGHVVYLRPEVVYEIAFDGVQRSSRYPGGVALRFARVKRFRDDKTPDEADTLESVRAFLG